MKIDIHNYPKRVANGIKLVQSSNISDRNKELIFEFRDFCSLDGMSLARISRYLGILKDWAVMLGKDFDVCDKKEPISVLTKLKITC